MKPAQPPLRLKPSFTNLLIFQFFFFVMHELHELTHIVTGRVICGAWGTRDFNVWQLCNTCNVSYPQIATFAGPLFTFAMLWLGKYLIEQGTSPKIRSLGLVFVFGNMPFGRIYMAATGSGDEVFGLRSLFINTSHSNLWLIRMTGFLIVALVCVPPLIAGYRAITVKQKMIVYIALLVVPLIMDTIVLLIILNGLIAKGILSQVLIMGTPLLVTVWFCTCTAIVLLNYKSLLSFAIDGGPIQSAKLLPEMPVS